MKRNVEFRRWQKEKHRKRAFEFIFREWNYTRKEAEEACKYFGDTPKQCNRECCHNPRKNKISGKAKLTLQERRQLDNYGL